MDQRGGCCIAPYAGGAYDISKVDRIMLRFRPIAPKPASGSCTSALPETCRVPNLRGGRGKRRQIGVGKRCGRKRRCSPENTDSGGSVRGGDNDKVTMIKTLPMLPGAPEVKEEAAAVSKRELPLWLSFQKHCGEGEAGSHETAAAAAAVVSWVKVECVTETWQVDGYPYGGIGRTDVERVRSLERDACPGFVSDGLGRVRWTNAAYRRMVAGGGEVAAWLVVEEGVALPPAVGFTCRVRVVTSGKDKASKTVPCDVWRMECGGLAWRLDTAAALSL